VGLRIHLMGHELLRSRAHRQFAIAARDEYRDECYKIWWGKEGGLPKGDRSGYFPEPGHALSHDSRRNFHFKSSHGVQGAHILRGDRGTTDTQLKLVTL
jgi:hypothetical protein